MRTRTVSSGVQSGFATVSLLLLLLPVLWMAGSYLRSMTGRNTHLASEVSEEKALLACESGLDVALYHARDGSIRSGKQYIGTLPGGASYTATAEYLGDDLLSNDGDAEVDEADEDVFRIRIDGTHGGASRRIAAYLGFTSSMTPPGSAMTTYAVPDDIDIVGSALIDGRNHDLAGGLVGSGDTPGLTTISPGTGEDLLALLSSDEKPKVEGLNGAPSVGQAGATPDLTDLVSQARNAAQIVITNGKVSSSSYGSATPGPQYIVFREGDLRITGNASGAGLLVVTGKLVVSGTFSWDGIVVILGDFSCGSGTASIRGAVLLGPLCTTIDLRGTVDILYSSSGVALGQRLAGRYVAYNGWQEISTR